MSMYLIAGSGSMPAKELAAQLNDLVDKAATDDVDCWFTVVTKDDPTDTDTALIKYLEKIHAYYERIDMGQSDLYASSAASVGKLGPEEAVRHLRKIAVTEDGGVSILILIDGENDGENDGEYTLDLIDAALAANIKVYGLNTAMVEITLVDVVETEPAPVVEEPVKKPRPAAPAKTVEDNADDERYNVLSSLEDWSPEELSGLTVEELRAICPQAPKKATKDDIIGILLGRTGPVASDGCLAKTADDLPSTKESESVEMFSELEVDVQGIANALLAKLMLAVAQAATKVAASLEVK
jgi:hypothetical protein